MSTEAIKIKVKKLHPDAKMPTTSYDGDVGYDIYAVEDVSIKRGFVQEVKTGIAVQVPEGYYCAIETRSSTGKAGNANHRGIIDPGYTGEISVFIRNVCILVGATIILPLEIKKGDRIAQLTFHKATYVAEFEEVSELDVTERGDKGHGSSGE